MNQKIDFVKKEPYLRRLYIESYVIYDMYIFIYNIMYKQILKYHDLSHWTVLILYVNIIDFIFIK